MRVIVTRIESGGVIDRHVVDTSGWAGEPEWVDLAGRALAEPPPYRADPGCRIYQISVDGKRGVLVAEHDLAGPLLELVSAVLAMGQTG